MTKKRVAESSTNFAQGGIAAVLSQLDNEKKHIRDTMIAGCFHNNRRAVAYMVNHSAAAIARLIALGVAFATKNGELLLTREGGHSERRIAFVSDYTGQAIERALVKKARGDPRIEILEHTFAADLLVKKGVCYGVRVIGEKASDILARATILATGGVGQLFSHTTNPAISTGDGLAMTARAGLKFRDLEFVQFHPTALNLKGKKPFLISEAVRGEGAHLINSDSERFMRRYDKRLELAPRDIVSRAIFTEEKRGPVYLDTRHIARDRLIARFPKIFSKLKSYGLDMSKHPIPISPAAHYLCGGIRVNLKGETKIKGLYAFGEVAGTGVHGANRLASNSLLEAVVFSDRILSSTTHYPLLTTHFPLPRLNVLSQTQARALRVIRRTLQKTMWTEVGIVRGRRSLLHAYKTLNDLARSPPLNFYTAASLETKNMLTASLLIAQAALNRKKSLGCHYVDPSTGPRSRAHR